MKQTTFTLLLLLSAFISYGQNLRSIIQEFESTNPGVSFSCAFIEAKTGELVFQYNQSSLTPASIMKVVSGATAMKSLGKDYAFCTQLQHTGTIKNDTLLNGNLIVKSGGDPTIDSKYFDSRKHIAKRFASEIKKLGIKSIKGDLIIDLSHLGNLNVPGSWLYEDIGNYYGASPSSMSCYDNLFTIELKSGRIGSLTKVVRTRPNIPEIRIVNFVKASKSNRDLAYVYSAPFSFDQQIRGTIPANRSSFPVKASLPNPPLLFGKTLKAELLVQGINLSGKEVVLRFAKSTASATTIYTDKSPALSTIEKPMLHHSVNLIADHVFLETIARQGKKVDFPSAGVYSLSFWAKQGVKTKGNFIEDGSGLSRGNAVQTSFVASVLQKTYADETVGKAFFNNLPQVGVEGTVRNYFKGTKFAKTMRAKTGTMTRVKSLAGKIGSQDKKEYTFCVITNNYSCSNSEVVRFYSKLFSSFYTNY